MNALERIIRDIIFAQGAITLESYMQLALQHPDHGYYRVREPVGRTGDFITAPEISQLFGEMIGVWCAESWRKLAEPASFALVELGPGRGTMMRDILRATENSHGFSAARKVYLLESDQALRRVQREKLGDLPIYIDDIGQLPDMPLIIVANEFFDSLPVRQFEKTFRGWGERRVTVANDALAMIIDAEINLALPHMPPDAKPGTVIELCAKAQMIMHDIAQRLVRQKGAMLLVDYGYTAPSGAPTVQAVSNHAFADIFDRPGEVDLTAHVDFSALAQAAGAAGAQVSEIIGQGMFLKNMGIDIRADQLKKHATLPQAASIDAGLKRLTDDDQMGSLFKVMEIRG